MMDKFCLAIEKYIIPVKPGRKNKRNNKYFFLPFFKNID